MSICSSIIYVSPWRRPCTELSLKKGFNWESNDHFMTADADDGIQAGLRETFHNLQLILFIQPSEED